MQKELLSLLGGLLLAGKNSPSGIENRTVQIDSESFQYQIHLPATSRDRKNLPVIVFLHGIRERGTDGYVPRDGPPAMFVNHYFQKIPAVVVLPQCRPGKYWSDETMEQMVMKALGQTLSEFEADEQKIYLAGVSMGGYGVWHFAARYPEKFAALVPICGGSPLLSGDRFAPIAGKISHIPTWIFHGAEDRVVPVSESREMVKAIRASGGAPKYSEYPKVGHHVWLNALQEKALMPWLFAQNKNGSTWNK